MKYIPEEGIVPLAPIHSQDETIGIKNRYLGMHALNPFSFSNSAARGYMFSTHLSQSLTLCNAEEPIITSGVVNQMSANTFSKKLPASSRIVAIINRYRGVNNLKDSVNKVVEKCIIFQNITTGEYDCLEIPSFHKIHQHFGFAYKWDDRLLNSLESTGTVLNEGTVFAKSNGVGDNGEYKFGLNANMALMSIPETAEDGFVISESYAKKLIYEEEHTYTFTCGSKKYAKNIYGDKDNYKVMPDLYEQLREDGVLVALSDYDDSNAAALYSYLDHMKYDPTHDTLVNAKVSDQTVESNFGYVKSSYVSDIKVIKGPHSKNSLIGTNDQLEMYANALLNYHNDIINVYNQIKKDHYKIYKDNKYKLSNNLNRLITDSLCLINPKNKHVEYKIGPEKLDMYNVTVTIRYVIKPGVGSKLTDSHGAKGVPVVVWKDEHMPTNNFGDRADIIADPTSIVSRMNPGRIHEQALNGASRKCRRLLRESLGMKKKNEYTDVEIKYGFDMYVDFLKIVSPEYYEFIRNLSDMNTIRDIIYQCIHDEVRFYYSPESHKRHYQIEYELLQSKFMPDITPLKFTSQGKEITTKMPILIAPIYGLILGKNADGFLSCASAKVNHFSTPYGVSKTNKAGYNFKLNPTKTIGETETRVLISYAGDLAYAEMKNRGCSVTTHKAIYDKLLKADQPTNIDLIIDREEYPYGDEPGLNLFNHIIHSAGFKLKYVDNNKK